MNDKMKALVEAARALVTHIKFEGSHGYRVHDLAVETQAALAALDAEPEVVWDGNNAQMSTMVRVDWNLGIIGEPADSARFWLAVPFAAPVKAARGVADTLELAKAAALRAARGEA